MTTFNAPTEGDTGEDRATHALVEKVRLGAMPIARLIGFGIDEIGNGRAVASVDSRPEHANPMGTLHGGVLCDVADAAMGSAFALTLAEDESFTTVALSINFLRPVWESRIRAEAHVAHRGKTLGYIECALTDQDNNVVAKATSTCAVLRGEQARLR